MLGSTNSFSSTMQDSYQQQLHQRQHSTLNNNNSNDSQQHPHPPHQHQHLVNHRTNNQQPNADDDYQDDHGMRVGNNYQAEIPQFIAYAPAPEYYEDEKAIRVWSPNNKIPEHVLDEFVNKAKDKFFYTIEQALGMLSWHRFDLNRAYADLPNFVPYPSEWSVEDKVLFEQAYQFHEKQFNKIKQMLPDKSMANLINYYYSWKKTRTRASLMERQTRRFAARKAADSNASSDEDEADEENEAETTNRMDTENGDNAGLNGQQAEDIYDKEKDSNNEADINCCICNSELRVDGQNLQVIVDGVIGSFCSKCYTLWRADGKKVTPQSELGDCFYHPAGEAKRILFTYQDVKSLVEGLPEAGDIMLKHLDSQVQDVKRDIQSKKQTLSQINEKIQPIANQIADLNMDEFADILPEYKPTKAWTNEETQLMIQGLRRYGTDFSAISDVIRTKSAETIKVFYCSQKERLSLSVLVEDFEKTRNRSSLPTDRPQKDFKHQPAVSSERRNSNQIE